MGKIETYINIRCWAISFGGYITKQGWGIVVQLGPWVTRWSNSKIILANRLKTWDIGKNEYIPPKE